MIIETHIIQNVSPANLNRDMTGAPKDAVFGGVRRARISSQALKRATRLGFSEAGLSEQELGVRTREVVRRVADGLVDRLGVDRTAATGAAEAAMDAIGVKIDKKKNGDGPAHVSYLLFLGSDAIATFTDRVASVYDRLSAGKGLKKGEVAGLQASDLFGGSAAADVALFGRMVADLPVHNIDAACQVAHAISTHQVSSEIDYFTAVDDEAAADGTGAGHIGELEFNSACFYRYSAIHTGQLVSNLGGDVALASRAVGAYLRSTVTNLPSGKQNSMAAFNPPSLVCVALREAGQWNLANAFADPVRDDVIAESCRRLVDYYGTLVSAFPSTAPAEARALAVGVKVDLAPHMEPVGDLDSLVGWIESKAAMS